MKAIFYSFTILLLTSSCDKNQDISIIENDTEMNQEIISSLQDFGLSKLRHYNSIIEISQDKTEPQRAKIFQEKLDLYSPMFIKAIDQFNFLLETDSIKQSDIDDLLTLIQSNGFNNLNLLVKKQMVFTNEVMDSVQMKTALKKLFENTPEYLQNSDFSSKLIEVMHHVKKRVVPSNVNSHKRKVEILLAKNKFLIFNEHFLYNFVSWCIADFSVRETEVKVKLDNETTVKDSITFQVYLSYVAEVDNSRLIIEGRPGRTWVQNNKCYFRTADTQDSLFQGQIGILNKSGDIKYKGFESTIRE